MNGRPRYAPSLALLAVLAFLVATPSAHSAHDDLAFARELVEARHYDLASDLLGRIAAEEGRAAGERDEARYALALIPKAQALAFGTEERFEAAAVAVDAFLDALPHSAHAPDARLERVWIPLAASAWARETDQHDAAFRFAQAACDAAADVAAEAPLLFYRARLRRAELPEDADAELALVAALIEDHRELHEGTPKGREAEHLLGEVLWEQARRSEDPAGLYGLAFSCFQAGLEGPVREAGHLERMARAYRFLAELAVEAAPRLPDDELLRAALRTLDAMPAARLRRTEDGRRAYVAWSRLLCRTGAVEQALRAAMEANLDVYGAAHKALLECLALHPRAVLDPELLQRVADTFFAHQQHEEAIRVYRRVIAATDATSEAFVAWRWHAWERMARSYRRLGDPLAEALAYEPIHEAWSLGWLHQRPDDLPLRNHIRAQNSRHRTLLAWGRLAEMTEAETFRIRERVARDSLFTDYAHPSDPDTWNRAIEDWKKALEMRRDEQDGWQAKVDEAYQAFVQISEDVKHDRADHAWVYRIRCMAILARPADALAEAGEAERFWGHVPPPEKLRQRRADTRAEAEFWMAMALVDLGRSEEAISHLEGYAARHPKVRMPYPQIARMLLLRVRVILGDRAGARRALATIQKEHPERVREGGLLGIPVPSPEQRSPDSLLLLAEVFHGASLWGEARAVYEVYLALPDVAALPATDTVKRRVLGRLARACIALGTEGAAPAVREDLLAKARSTLESILANDPADWETIDGMLANRFLIVEYTTQGEGGKSEYLRIPHCDTPAELRSILQGLAWRTKDPDVERWLLRLAGGGGAELLDVFMPSAYGSLFHPGFYASRANTDPLFRLNLAKIYARSSAPADELRAWNLVQSLLLPPLAVDEDSEEGWGARVLDWELRVRRASRAIRGAFGGAIR